MQEFSRQWNESKKRARERTVKKNAHERNRIGEHNDPWTSYRLNAEQYIKVFAVNFPHIERLSKRFAERHKRGESVLVVDVCGIANARTLGADHTIGFTLNKPPRIDEDESMTIVEGDIFTSHGQNKLISAIDARHTPISCVFFRPVAGMVGYGETPHTFARLYALLQKLFESLADGGEMYIATREFPTGMDILHRILPELGIETEYKSLQNSKDEMPSLYIKKTSGNKLPIALPLSAKDRSKLKEVFLAPIKTSVLS